MTGHSYLITGTSKAKGLGLGVAKHILAGSHDAIVILTARKPSAPMSELAEAYPGRVILQALSTTDEASIEAAVKELEGQLHHGLDYLWNNAGVGGGEGFKHPIETTKQEMLDTFETNTVGSFLVTKAFMPLLRKGTKKTIVNTSSGLGSITNVVKNFAGKGEYNEIGARLLTYRQSKAALDMQSAVLACALKDEGFTVISLDPGWVATDMGDGAADANGKKPDWDTETSTKKQLEVVHGLTPKDSGKFFTLTGEELPF